MTSTQVEAGSTTPTPGHPVGQDAAVELGAELGELGAVVAALDEPVVGDDQRAGGPSGPVRVGDDIGEVDLALVVVRAQGRQGGAQVGGVEDVDTGVDLSDGALGLAGVALLDDGRDGAVGLAHDAPVAGGVVELGGQQGDGVPPLGVLGQELR